VPPRMPTRPARRVAANAAAENLRRIVMATSRRA
jgi:hypothetical protein